MDCSKRFAWMASLVWLVCFAPGAWAQSEGSGLMLAGNAAFRSGNFEAAQREYRAAIASGYDSALLRYNLGVAHYRLGEYAEAELALQIAASEPALTAIATYNLGLTALAAGWFDDARNRFSRVLTVSTDSNLTGLAERALERVDAREAEERSRAVSERRPYREPDPPVGEFYFAVAARVGTDDNVYRSPSAPYVDLARAGQPTVVPIQQSATFMPVDLLASYSIEAPEQSTIFDFSYRMNGDFYDSEFSNATELTQRFEMAADVLLEGRHERYFDAAFFAVTHDETNFDPDTGIDRDIAGQDVSNRFSYKGAGIETGYEQVLSRWAFGFDTHIERRSYESAPIVIPYDHEFYHVDFWVERGIGDSSALLFTLDSYRREYDARRARDLAGVLSLTNPTLEYSYLAAEIGVERRLSQVLRLSGSVQRTERTDNFEGYSDYSQNMLRIALDYRPSRSLRLQLGVWGRRYDYPNAFAFNDPIGGPLEIESTNAELDLEYRFNSAFSVWTEFLFRDESSTDPRLPYTRSRVVLGLKWRH